MPETSSRKPEGGYRANWDPKNLFIGTAEYYARYRPGYPPKAIRTLAEKFGLNEGSRVIDLGCGPGKIALKLAPYVGEVIAIDPQEEMLEEGRKIAARRNINNIIWRNGLSTELTGMVKAPGEIDLVVIARAFHWMDRKKTLEDVYSVVRAGGGIAVINDRDPLNQPEVAWREIIKAMIREWLGEERRAGTAGTFAPLPKTHEEVVQESRFRDMIVIYLNTMRTWTTDRIIGYVFSTSYASVPVLGEKKEAFEADLRRRLTGLEPSGRFRERATTEIIMAWKR